MTTVELDPIIREHVDDQEHDSDDPSICHLYVRPIHTMCGLPPEKDPHWGCHKERINWSPGVMACPKCGAPICMDCLLSAS